MVYSTPKFDTEKIYTPLNLPLKFDANFNNNSQANYQHIYKTKLTDF